MHRRLIVAIGLIGISAVAFGAARQQGDRQSPPSCEWCGTGEAPDGLASMMTIAGPDEAGERIVLRGRVFEVDGETPAAGVVMYAYHTDATGVYRKDGDVTGNEVRHGSLRGWLVTDDEGRYEIRTIRPASYPNSSVSQHVHVTLQAPRPLSRPCPCGATNPPSLPTTTP